MKRLVLFLIVGLILLPESIIAQIKEPEIISRIQIRAVNNKEGDNQFLVKRCRFLLSGYLLPKISFKVQHGFSSNQLKDAWVSYKVPNLEIRVGQSWLPFVGDFVESPFFIDPIDFSVGVLLFPAREKGIFILGNHKSLFYKLSIVNGNGFDEDDNKWKDVFGSLKYKSSIFEGEIGHYEGRKGPDGSLIVKRWSALQVILNPNHLFTFKGAYILGKDEFESKGGWFRALIHLSKSIEFISEFDNFNRDGTTRYYVNGLNYYFAKNSKLMFNYRYFDCSPNNQKSDFKIQLQVFSPNLLGQKTQ